MQKPFLAAVACLAAACAATPHTPIPEALTPGEAKLAMVVPAKGVQIYECRAKGAAFEWAFVAPDAELFDTSGRRIGHHGAGPFWQAADGSRVNGSVKARADAPAPAADIPWLLLTTKSTGPEGTFSNVTLIQRVNTVGGIAPAQACDAASLGRQARVAYTADYRLFTAY